MTKTEESRKYRAKMRLLGFIPKHVWVRPKDWPAVQALIKALTKEAKQ